MIHLKSMNISLQSITVSFFDFCPSAHMCIAFVDSAHICIAFVDEGFNMAWHGC